MAGDGLIPRLLRSGGPGREEQERGIVNMASILGQVGFARSPAYVAAKHGLVRLTRAAALEYATQGIRRER
jgi:NAD(P)-dependent dehydrogenase (short-subunit alcohol dehydrogenase family)